MLNNAEHVSGSGSSSLGLVPLVRSKSPASHRFCDERCRDVGLRCLVHPMCIQSFVKLSRQAVSCQRDLRSFHNSACIHGARTAASESDLRRRVFDCPRMPSRVQGRTRSAVRKSEDGMVFRGSAGSYEGAYGLCTYAYKGLAFITRLRDPA